MKCLLFLCIIFSVQQMCAEIVLSDQPEPIHFFIVIPTYHNREWCIENIESVIKQTYPHWHVYITVDGSPYEDDGTGLLLHDYCQQHPEIADKITIHQNTQRLYALANIYNAVHNCPDPSWVVVILDGDDLLFDEHVLARVAQEYENQQTWMTYGQFIYWPRTRIGSCQPFPPHVINKQLFREYPWVASHLRTFYAWLFKLIDKQDLLYRGKFFEVAYDLAIMFPMLEMACDGHICFIEDPLYIYRVHQSNDCAVRSMFVVKMSDHIRNQKRYKPLMGNPLKTETKRKEIPEKLTTYRKLFPKKR